MTRCPSCGVPMAHVGPEIRACAGCIAAASRFVDQYDRIRNAVQTNIDQDIMNRLGVAQPQGFDGQPLHAEDYAAGRAMSGAARWAEVRRGLLEGDWYIPPRENDHFRDAEVYYGRAQPPPGFRWKSHEEAEQDVARAIRDAARRSQQGPGYQARIRVPPNEVRATVTKIEDSDGPGHTLAEKLLPRG